MRVAYFDCPSGAAGDMVMGALVDAGVPFEALRTELAKLGSPADRGSAGAISGPPEMKSLEELSGRPLHQGPRT